MTQGKREYLLRYSCDLSAILSNQFHCANASWNTRFARQLVGYVYLHLKTILAEQF